MIAATTKTFGRGARLDALGFERRGASFRRGALAIAPGRDFWTFSLPAAGGASCLQGQIGRPGLWKLVGAAPAHRAWEFHLPASLLGDVQSSFEPNGDSVPDAFDDEIEGADMLSACIAWAEATFDGEVHSAWRPPSKQRLEEWLGKDRLTVQSGPLVRQAMVLCERRRLTVRFPLVHQASGQLSPVRRTWLDQTLADAQNRWRIARVGYTDCGKDATGLPAPAVCAEIDLTGVPQAALECLLKTGVDGLRWVVSWLLWPVGFLSDPSVTSSAWEIPPERAFGPRKGESHA